jgi:hypothetical protein
LKALGADPNDVSKYFLYLPDLSPTVQEGPEAVRLIAEQGADLAVFDSLADFYIASGLEEQSNRDATEWSKALPEPLAHDYGVATIGVDHTGHADTSRARGASAKGAKADATWQVEVEEGHEFDVENTGLMRLMRGRKNRQGVLPESHVLKIGGDGKGGTVFERLPDREADEEKKRRVQADKELKRAVLELLSEAGEEGMTKTRLIKALRDAGHKGDTGRMGKKLNQYAGGAAPEIGFKKEGTKHIYYILQRGKRGEG